MAPITAPDTVSTPPSSTMPSKWLRTKAASLCPRGMSSVVPGPLRFFDDGISAAPLLNTLRTGAPIFG